MADDVKWLMAREIPYLRRYARGLTGDPHLADDVVQDALERALRKRHQWRRTGSMRGWLYRILYSVYLNGLKAGWYRTAAVTLDQVEVEPARAANQPDAVEIRGVIRALHALPVDQRAAILLVALEGMSYDEVSAVMGVPVGTVRSRLSRGRAALRRLDTGETGRVHLRRVK